MLSTELFYSHPYPLCDIYKKQTILVCIFLLLLSLLFSLFKKFPGKYREISAIFMYWNNNVTVKTNIYKSCNCQTNVILFFFSGNMYLFKWCVSAFSRKIDNRQSSLSTEAAEIRWDFCLDKSLIGTQRWATPDASLSKQSNCILKQVFSD